MLKINKVTIMEIPFIDITLNDFMKKIVKPKLELAKRYYIVTANPEIVMAAQKDTQYKHILQDADYVVPDGSGILLAAKLKKQPLQERIAGIELMAKMLELANDKGASCYFLGASEAVNIQAVENIHAAYPHIQIAGLHHGYFDLDDEHISEEIAKVQPDFVFVALGFPKQEKWIAANINKFNKGCFMGVGGSFDIFAGNIKRAPEFWIKWNLEWLHRILKQPSRIKRMFPLVKFVLLMFRKK